MTHHLPSVWCELSVIVTPAFQSDEDHGVFLTACISTVCCCSFSVTISSPRLSFADLFPVVLPSYYPLRLVLSQPQ